MVTIYDSHQYSYYLKAMKNEGVPFRKGTGNKIWYSIKYKEAEARAREKMHSYYSAGCGFHIESFDREEELRILLEKDNIPYWIAQTDDGNVFVCEPEFTETAKKLFYKVMFNEL